jgi:hypothetical protein
MSRKPINKKLSTLFAETLSWEKSMVLTSCPWVVPKPVLSTTARHPSSGADRQLYSIED